jgi:hypothetical protein
MVGVRLKRDHRNLESQAPLNSSTSVANPSALSNFKILLRGASGCGGASPKPSKIEGGE